MYPLDTTSRKATERTFGPRTAWQCGNCGKLLRGPRATCNCGGGAIPEGPVEQVRRGGVRGFIGRLIGRG